MLSICLFDAHNNATLLFLAFRIYLDSIKMNTDFVYSTAIFICVWYIFEILNCALQALFLLVGVIFTFLPGTEEDTPNTVAISSVIVSVVLLIIADIGC